ncbi:MAG: hypothetical protein PHI94_04975 [Eubacteriaceae bacterium]|jgi:hypothetical protein|nr:hypothetical protein [Eubacteriaceae bacterium]MDD4507445.1 hypothetical protein [Eubacteriaceae bacterium]
MNKQNILKYESHFVLIMIAIGLLCFFSSPHALATENQSSEGTSNEAIAIVDQPISQQVQLNGSVTYQVTISDSEKPVTFQWYSIKDENSAPTAIEGQTDQTLVINNVTEDMNNSQYYCLVQSNSQLVYSEMASLEVVNNELTAEQQEFQVEAKVDDATMGSVTPSMQTVPAGQDISITATPTNGYGFDHWIINGEVSNNKDNVLTITSINSDTSVMAVFKKIDKPTIQTDVLPGGRTGVYYCEKIEASGSEPIEWQLTGNIPEGWSIDSQSGLLECTSPLTGNINLVIQARNSAGVISRNYTVSIQDTKDPIEPVVDHYNDTSVELMTASDQEYSIDNGLTWQSNGFFSSLQPNTDYSILTRIVGETDVISVSVKTKISSPSAPNAPELSSVSNTSLAINTVTGQEYSIDDGKTWQSNGLFTNLKQNTEYQIITRTVETSSVVAGQPSSPLKAKTSNGSVDTVINNDTFSDGTPQTLWDDLVGNVSQMYQHVVQFIAQII